MTGQLFDWTIERTEKDYRVVIVEPSFIEPANHGGLFNSVITALLTSEDAPISDLRPNVPLFDRFDLVTFPEAFLPIDDFIRAIDVLSRLDRIGCIHVGLRPDQNDGHLFDKASILALLAQLRLIPAVELEDLNCVVSWIERQHDGKRFNLACLFTIDVGSKLRICLRYRQWLVVSRQRDLSRAKRARLHCATQSSRYGPAARKGAAHDRSSIASPFSSVERICRSARHQAPLR